jgi:hypothetical protein
MLKEFGRTEIEISAFQYQIHPVMIGNEERRKWNTLLLMFGEQFTHVRMGFLMEIPFASLTNITLFLTLFTLLSRR